MDTTKKLNILVVDDSIQQQDAARDQLSAHNLTVVGTYDEAQELLLSKVNNSKRDDILRAQFGHCRASSCKDEEKDSFWVADGLAKKEATTYPGFDVVLLDLMLPASMCGAGGPGNRLAGQEMPLGTTLAFLALKNRCKNVAVVTDTNHHDHPASAALDIFWGGSFEVGDAKIYLSNCERGVKNWAEALETVIAGRSWW